MTLKGIIQFSHKLLEQSVMEGETVIDATCGNGKDTLFLSDLVGSDGHVIAFDVQRQAIENTKQLLSEHNRTNTSVVHDSHAYLSEYVTMTRCIGGAIFNLGYLPKSDKTVITQGESTINAVDSICQYLRKDGLIVIVVYYGHAGGSQEKEALLEYLVQLDQKEYSVLRYGFINQRNTPPFILAIQKK